MLIHIPYLFIHSAIFDHRTDPIDSIAYYISITTPFATLGSTSIEHRIILILILNHRSNLTPTHTFQAFIHLNSSGHSQPLSQWVTHYFNNPQERFGTHFVRIWVIGHGPRTSFMFSSLALYISYKFVCLPNMWFRLMVPAQHARTHTYERTHMRILLSTHWLVSCNLYKYAWSWRKTLKMDAVPGRRSW